jgi:hypothetical protein
LGHHSGNDQRLRFTWPKPIVWLQRPGSPASAKLVGRIADLDVAARRTGRPALVSYQGENGQALELFLSRGAEGYVATYSTSANNAKPRRRCARHRNWNQPAR